MTNRREMLKLTALGGAALASGAEVDVRPRQSTGLKQAVCRWPFAGLPDAKFYPMVKSLGFGAVDLLTEKEWPVAEQHGLICSMGTPTERRDFISYGLNDRRHHAILLPELERAIPAARKHGVPNVIAMIGNREGRTDADAIAACAEGLRKVAPLAEQEGVTICLELLNSRVDHKDFQGDRMRFGLELMQAVDSSRVRLLYDIYHMQIMEGDIIRTIRDHGKWIAHYHTAGNPGRNELDPTQELNYAGIAKAIADTGFTGWIAHEFIPTRDARKGLADAMRICG